MQNRLFCFTVLSWRHKSGELGQDAEDQLRLMSRTLFTASSTGNRKMLEWQGKILGLKGKKFKACFVEKGYKKKNGKYLYKLKTYRVRLFCIFFSLYWSNWKFKEGFYRLPFGSFHLNISKIVDSSKLNKSRKHKGKADRNEPVHGSSIWYFWQWVSCTDAQCRHCQHCGYSFKETKQKHCWMQVNQTENMKVDKQLQTKSFISPMSDLNLYLWL